MDCRAAGRVRDAAGIPNLRAGSGSARGVGFPRLEQSRVLLDFVRKALANVEAEHRWLDPSHGLAATPKATGTKFWILSSNGKRAMGLANFSTIFARRTQSLGGSRRGADVGRATPGARQAGGPEAHPDQHQSSGGTGQLVANPDRQCSGPGVHVTELSDSARGAVVLLAHHP